MVTILALFSCTKKRKAEPVAQRPAPGAPQVPAELNEPEIRVAVRKMVSAANFHAPAGLNVQSPDGGAGSWRLAPGGVSVQADAGGVSVNGRRMNGAVLTSLEPGRFLALDGQELAPKAVIYPSGGALTVIAYLPLESYLAGVLAGEVPYARWHPEALKAQAVASRSYALFQMKSRAREAYDVEADVMSQVFKSGQHHEPVLEQATSATRGLVVTYQGRLFPAYFHSTSGGHTEDVASVFPEQASIAPLAGARSPFSSISPVYTWTATLDKEALRGKLAAAPEVNGQPVGALRDLRFLTSARSPRRAEVVEVIHANGSFRLPANRFRLIAGAGQLRSVWIDRTIDRGSAFEFQGRGFGHGVGMCQYGSQGMAQQGYRFEQILGLYYPGADMTKLYGGSSTAMR